MDDNKPGFAETILAEPFHRAQSFASAELQREIVALRLAAPIRPHDRSSADVDGLDLFDFARSPRLI